MMHKSSYFGSRLQRREALEGYLWISPWLIGFLVFSLGPIIASFYLSLTKYKIGGTPEWLMSNQSTHQENMSTFLHFIDTSPKQG